jgi:hypothetical protein
MKRLLLTMVHSRADRCIDLNDHGRSRGPRSVGGGSRLAVVVTVAKGYDLGYVWKTPGEARVSRCLTAADGGIRSLPG